MAALLHHARLSIERLWLRFVNVLSLLWAIGHCWITAFGTQEQRFVAASAGVVGATIILVVLNLSIRQHVIRTLHTVEHRSAIRRVLRILEDI